MQIPHILEGFLFSGLLCVAPYCVRGGVKVVSLPPFLRSCTVGVMKDRKYGLARIHRLKPGVPKNPKP